jgi:hypothetical protein
MERLIIESHKTVSSALATETLSIYQNDVSQQRIQGNTPTYSDVRESPNLPRYVVELCSSSIIEKKTYCGGIDTECKREPSVTCTKWVLSSRLTQTEHYHKQVWEHNWDVVHNETHHKTKLQIKSVAHRRQDIDLVNAKEHLLSVWWRRCFCRWLCTQLNYRCTYK